MMLMGLWGGVKAKKKKWERKVPGSDVSDGRRCFKTRRRVGLTARAARWQTGGLGKRSGTGVGTGDCRKENRWKTGQTKSVGWGSGPSDGKYIGGEQAGGIVSKERNSHVQKKKPEGLSGG